MEIVIDYSEYRNGEKTVFMVKNENMANIVEFVEQRFSKPFSIFMNEYKNGIEENITHLGMQEIYKLYEHIYQDSNCNINPNRNWSGAGDNEKEKFIHIMKTKRGIAKCYMILYKVLEPCYKELY